MMRVIAGEFRRRLLKTVPGKTVRPTPDRMREALFSILAPRLEGVVFVDAYAGSGSVGIEALSRGAGRAVFIEKHRESIVVLRENIVALKLQQRSEVMQRRAAEVIAEAGGEIVFLDPPYEELAEYEGCFRALSEAPPPLVVVQHATRIEMPDEYGKLRRYRIVKQGDNSLSFYSPE
jgi:16S rRNA (guanine966-N2)-methyltransferase